MDTAFDLRSEASDIVFAAAPAGTSESVSCANDSRSSDSSGGIEFAEAVDSDGGEDSTSSSHTTSDEPIVEFDGVAEFDASADRATAVDVEGGSPHDSHEPPVEFSDVEFSGIEFSDADSETVDSEAVASDAGAPALMVAESPAPAESQAIDADAVQSPTNARPAVALHSVAQPVIAPLTLAASDDVPTESRAEVRSGWYGGLASAVLHIWVLITLAGITHTVQRAINDEPLDMSVSHSEKAPEFDDEDPVVRFELANPGDKEMEVRQTVNAMSVGRERGEKPVVASIPNRLAEIDLNLPGARPVDLSIGAEVDERIVVKGTTGEGLIQIESALDRVTWEIAQNMKERKVLVVWMLDASGSLVKQRAAVAKRLKRIYGELGALQDIGELPRLDKPLLTGVVSYGQSFEYLTKDPTDKFDTIADAFARVKADESGVENVFTSLGAVLKNWSKYRTSFGRRIMFVVVTDETGDDFGKPMEETISLCRRFGAKAYVVGPSAVFARRKGFIPYVAPENGRTYQIPVDLGPESAALEVVRLPFWYEGPQFEYLSSGFGPYALSRLVNETGGVYFMTSMTTMDGLSPLGAFDPAALKPFTPEYRFGSPKDYEADLTKHPIRYATVMAASLAEENQPPGMPNMELRVNANNYRQLASNAQQRAAEIQLSLDTILQAFPPNIEKQLEKEPSVRWRASFCLSYGRLLAQKTRCVEYNTALAQMKGALTPDDVTKKSNHWIIRPDKEVNYATTQRRSAKLAEELLRRVIDEAPGTPWAILAARELSQPFGLKVVERFIPPPPPAPQRPAEPAPRRPRLAQEPRPQQPPAQPAKPQPPPKLPKL